MYGIAETPHEINVSLLEINHRFKFMLSVYVTF